MISVVGTVFQQGRIEGVRPFIALKRVVNPDVDTTPEGASSIEVDGPAEIRARPFSQNAGRLHFPTQDMVNSLPKELPEVHDALPPVPHPLAQPGRSPAWGRHNLSRSSGGRRASSSSPLRPIGSKPRYSPAFAPSPAHHYRRQTRERLGKMRWIIAFASSSSPGDKCGG